ncbi:MAG: DarT ssDNA thymidine ADP-ribosyltransferase family protein, partial [Thermoflexales bacterium]
ARPWAISDGNAGAMYATFANDLVVLDRLDWDAIHATYWPGKVYAKAAELLVAEFFPWTAFHRVGCHNADVAQHVRTLLNSQWHRPDVTVQEGWYY